MDRESQPAAVRQPGDAMIKPVLDLFSNIAALREACESCAKDPTAGAVHHLRSSVVRIQALLRVVALLPDAPDFGRTAKRLRKATRLLRRAAGGVRDLDVHLELLRAIRAPQGQRQEAKALMAKLEKKRARRARKLSAEIVRRLPRLHRRLDQLEIVLAPVREGSLAQSQVLDLARSNFASARATLHPESPDDLHGLRKSAKISRYIAEAGTQHSAGPEGRDTARSTAQAFRRIQQAGGEWHDALLLVEEASHTLQPASPLVDRLVHRRDATHRKAIRQLQEGRAPQSFGP